MSIRLAPYIAEVDGSELAFARRCGVRQRTINRIAAGKVRCRIDIAALIVRASQERPTSAGEFVDFTDLLPESEAA